LSDAKKIRDLIGIWAKKNKMLDRSLNYIYENIRDFWVCREKNRLLGCCALHVVGWESLAEIKSLAVDPAYQHQGIARSMVAACIEEARSMGITGVFALTFVAGFFKRLGFKKTDRNALPHKIWSDCVNCTFFPDCRETAVILKIKNNKSGGK